MDWGHEIDSQTLTYFVLNSASIWLLGTTFYETVPMDSPNRFKNAGSMNITDFTTHFILFLLELKISPKFWSEKEDESSFRQNSEVKATKCTSHTTPHLGNIFANLSCIKPNIPFLLRASLWVLCTFCWELNCVLSVENHHLRFIYH